MKLGFYTLLFSDLELSKALDVAVQLGLDAVEIPSGGFVGYSHCDPGIIIKDNAKFLEFKRNIEERGLFISALSCHANPIHPIKEIAKKHDEDLTNTILLAEKLGVGVVVTFSGCPGTSDSDITPNWITSSWPEYYLEALEWQWKEKIIPYWKNKANFAHKHGNIKIAIEMHGGFSVFNPDTLMKLRNASGDNIGCNFDPSHLFWQKIDPITAVQKLNESIYHIHAKDTHIDIPNCSENGLLELKPYNDLDRSWIFRTVGYGHDQLFWKRLVSVLAKVNYDYVLSIEHEDVLMSREEGLRKAAEILKGAIVRDKPGKMWWS